MKTKNDIVPLVKYKFSVKEEMPVGTKVGRLLSNRSLKLLRARSLTLLVKAYGKHQGKASDRWVMFRGVFLHIQ